MIKTFKMLLIGFLLTSVIPASAGSFRLKTGKAVGEKLSIAINAGIPLKLTWSDGTIEEMMSTGDLQEITVKTNTLTVSSEKTITALYLAENELTELVVNDVASTLRRLYCSDNKLKTLNLSSCSELISLDCQGNELETLSIGSAQMEDLNIADNKLTKHGLSSATNAANVTSLVCANNKITTVSYLSSMTGLKALFCQGNQLSSLGTSKCVELQNVLAFDNKLTSFNSAPLVNLKNLWIGGNQLETLDLSAVKTLEGVTAQGNQLQSITWNSALTSKKALKYVDLSDNALFFNSLPTIYNAKDGINVDAYIGNQEPYQLLTDINVNQTSDNMKPKLGTNGMNDAISTNFTIQDQNGQILEKGEDYKYSANRFIFLKAFNGVTIAVTSSNYPDVTLTTLPFNVIDPLAVQQIETDAVEAVGPVYDLQGRRVSNSGSHNPNLSKGLYIVNGKKIVIR